jgi:NAD(P)-dependent dehydrogenase (short-subunit alcohol dehydrogenase family)
VSRGIRERGRTGGWCGHHSIRPIALPERVKEFGSDIPMKRAAQPEELAPAFAFMAAPSCSSYITGEILLVIGGYSGG